MKHLEWLGHIAHMPQHRIPNQVPFSGLPQPGSAVCQKYLEQISVREDEWYKVAMSSGG